jgi:hypothetical protein
MVAFGGTGGTVTFITGKARSPNRGPFYWKATVLRRHAGSDGK